MRQGRLWARTGCFILGEGMKTRLLHPSSSQLSPDVKDITDILSTYVSNIHLQESMFWLVHSSLMAGTNIF